MSETNPFNVRKPASVVAVKETKAAEGASRNFSANRIIGMTFNMPEDWHQDFKRTAVDLGVSMKELLVMSFDAYKRDNKRR